MYKFLIFFSRLATLSTFSSPRASWRPEQEDREALVTHDLKSWILELPVISDFLQRFYLRSLPLAEVSMTVNLGASKLLKENPLTFFWIGNDQKSWSSCSDPQEALGTRMRWVFATLETWRKLGGVNVCQAFWDCYQGRGKLTNSWEDTFRLQFPLSFKKWRICSWQMRWTNRFFFSREIYCQVAFNQSLSNFRQLGCGKGLIATKNSILSYWLFNAIKFSGTGFVLFFPNLKRIGWSIINYVLLTLYNICSTKFHQLFSNGI